jgi:hypothetical protein
MAAGRKKFERGLHSTSLAIFPDQLDKFRKLGGSAWVRRKLDEDTEIDYKDRYEGALAVIRGLQRDEV